VPLLPLLGAGGGDGRRVPPVEDPGGEVGADGGEAAVIGQAARSPRGVPPVEEVRPGAVVVVELPGAGAHQALVPALLDAELGEGDVLPGGGRGAGDARGGRDRFLGGAEDAEGATPGARGEGGGAGGVEEGGGEVEGASDSSAALPRGEDAGPGE